MTHPHYRQQIGETLTREREARRLTLENASQLLHIRAKYLQALESGELEGLPGGVYTKGYLQAYAQFLDLDRDEILRRFEQLGALPERRGFLLPEVLSAEKTPGRGLVQATLAAAFVLCLIVALVVTGRLKPASPIDTPPAPASSVMRDATLTACVENALRYYPPCTAVLPPAPDWQPVIFYPEAMLAEDALTESGNKPVILPWLKQDGTH